MSIKPPLLLLLLLALSPLPFCRAETTPPLSDEALLDTIQEHSFRYFSKLADRETGLIPDRASNFGLVQERAPASIAASGFALTAYAVGVERNWMDISEAKARTTRALDFLLHRAEHERGFFYHFMNAGTGKKSKDSEVSPIDTAILLAGILFAREYYQDDKITQLADQIYARIDWHWMLNQGKTFALAWKPKEGFDQRRWDHFDESLLLYLLAMGAPDRPISEESWHMLERPVGSYKDYRLIQMPPLFAHQYPHIWVDFRGIHDGYADYFKNSVNATLANRAFCIDQSKRFSSYHENSWGLTASQGPFGYRAYGAPPGWAEHDGTIAPTGCGSSIVFTPKESMACLRYFYENMGDQIWGEYGFSDAFNLKQKWFAQEVLAIDQGALLLMIENYRSELIWKTMSRNSALQAGLKKAGFKEGSIDPAWVQPPRYEAEYLPGGIEIDGYLRDWSKQAVLELKADKKELGDIQDDQDLSGQIRFGWDEHALYFAAKISDESLVQRKSGKNLWMDDCLELYFDPDGDGLFWNDGRDFQMGFRNETGTDEVHTWSWFQGGEDPAQKGKMAARGFTDATGYIIEGAIRWSYLGYQPEEGRVLNFSVAIHDIDQDRSQAKLQWFFRHEKAFQRFALGTMSFKKSNVRKVVADEIQEP